MKTPCENIRCPHNEKEKCWFKNEHEVETCKRLIAFKAGTYEVKRYIKKEVVTNE